jgi:hypothetical protein
MSETEKKTSIFDDLDALAVAPNEAAGAMQEVLTHVPLQRPGRQVFFRTNPDPSWSLTTSIVFDEEGFGRDAYLVLPQMRGELLGEVRTTLVSAIMTRQGVFQLWPLKLPLDDGHPNAWYESAREALELSRTRWVCMRPDLSLGAYRVLCAIGDLPDPVWPDRPFRELLDIAFRGRIIDSSDHPLVRRLRGAA